MPLTPRFSLTQSPTHVYVEISVPSFRLAAGEDGGMEVVLTGERNSEFHFYAKPYLLKLNFFPNGFVDDEEEEAKGSTAGSKSSARYDPSEQTVVVPLRKKLRSPESSDDDANRGEHEDNNNSNNNHWPDLELTARMVEAKPIPKQWLHAVVDEGESEDYDDNDGNIDEEDSNDPTPTTPNDPRLLLPEHRDRDGYGFANLFRNVFVDYCRSGLAEEMLEGVRIAGINPEASTIDERRDERISAEDEGFDLERYLADLELPVSPEQDYLYPMVREYEPWWRAQTQTHPRQSSANVDIGAPSANPLSLIRDMDNLTIRGGDNDNDTNDDSNQTSKTTTTLFTDDEKLLLSTIPYPLLPKHLLAAPGRNDDHATTGAFTHYRLWCAAFELVLAYVYDHLTTMGDPSVESSWTISILSCGLSWLDSSPTASLRDTLVTVLRRILIHPYFRNADDLGRRVCSEALCLVKTHRRAGVAKALLQVRSILDKSEVHYMGNKLWVDPCLYWIQNHLYLRTNIGDGGGDDPVLEAILDEWSALVTDDNGFASLLAEVEASLGIPEQMAEYFGEEHEHKDEVDASSSNSSDEDEDEDSSSEEEGDTDKENDGQSSAATATNPPTIDGTVRDTAATPAASATQLLDDQVGEGRASSISSLLHCVPASTGSGSGAATTAPSATRSALLIEELSSPGRTQEEKEEDRSKDDSRRPLIQEL
eukprot:jgi/Psemu1/57156/gm1.57156_g